MGAASPIVVVGAGMAGYQLIKALREQDSSVPVCLVTADRGTVYSKPMLSNALSRGKAPDDLVQASAVALAQQYQFELMAETPVQAIDVAKRQLICAHSKIDYRACILATGSRACQPSVVGGELAYQVNSLEQYQAFYAAIQGKSHITVIGSGLVGVEFAQDLVAAGYAVTVVHQADTPVDQLLIASAGQRLQAALAAQGVSWQMHAQVAALRQDGGDHLVCEFANGQHWQTDVVLSATGIEPRAELAREAGLPVAQAIVTDSYCRVADDVYALGDCAQVAGQHLCYVPPIRHCAAALAKTLTGQPTAVNYPLMPITLKTPACPTVVLPPAADSDGEWRMVVDDEAGLNAEFIDATGQLRGFILMGAQVVQRTVLLQACQA